MKNHYWLIYVPFVGVFYGLIDAMFSEYPLLSFENVFYASGIIQGISFALLLAVLVNIC